jgi:hypothetical protein
MKIAATTMQYSQGHVVPHNPPLHLTMMHVVRLLAISALFLMEPVQGV